MGYIQTLLLTLSECATTYILLIFTLFLYILWKINKLVRGKYMREHFY